MVLIVRRFDCSSACNDAAVGNRARFVVVVDDVDVETVVVDVVDVDEDSDDVALWSTTGGTAAMPSESGVTSSNSRSCVRPLPTTASRRNCDCGLTEDVCESANANM